VVGFRSSSAATESKKQLDLQQAKEAHSGAGDVLTARFLCELIKFQNLPLNLSICPSSHPPQSPPLPSANNHSCNLILNSHAPRRPLHEDVAEKPLTNLILTNAALTQLAKKKNEGIDVVIKYQRPLCRASDDKSLDSHRPWAGDRAKSNDLGR
jgi:hypothetical protein